MVHARYRKEEEGDARVESRVWSDGGGEKSERKEEWEREECRWFAAMIKTVT